MPTSSFPASLTRMIIVVVLFFGLGGAAIAGQIDPDGIKDRQGSDDAESTPEVSPGLVGEGDYVSPQFGTGITWTDAWDLGDLDNPLVEFAIGGNFDAAITSDPTAGDVLWLMDTASESAVLGVFIAPADGYSPEIMMQLMGQPDFLEENLFVSRESDTLLLDATETTAAILVRDADTPEHIVYLEVVFPEGEDHYVWVGFDLWEPEAYDGVFADVTDGIEISGVDMFSVASPEELLALINDPDAGNVVTPDADSTEEPEDTPEADATEESEPTGDTKGTPDSDATEESSADYPGLIAEGEYESPQHGAGITWSDSWVIDESRDEPIGSDENEGFDSVFLTDAASERTVVFMTVEELVSSDPDDILTQITADDYNENIFGIDPASELLLSDSSADSAAILVVDDSGSEPLVILMEVHALNDDGLVAFVEFRAFANDIDEDVLTALEQELEIESRPALTVFSVDEILTELDGI